MADTLTALKTKKKKITQAGADPNRKALDRLRASKIKRPIV